MCVATSGVNAMQAASALLSASPAWPQQAANATDYGVPTYQALLTLLTIISGGLFFSEFDLMPTEEAVAFGCGVVITLVGVALHSTHRSELQLQQRRGMYRRPSHGAWCITYSQLGRALGLPTFPGQLDEYAWVRHVGSRQTPTRELTNLL